jgi:hypothetical protein
VLVLGVIQAPNWGWGSARTIAVLAAGAAALAAFVAVESRTAHPMLDVALFRNPRFATASASVAVTYFALQGFIFLTTQYLQVVKGYGALSTGVRLLPVAGSVAVAAVAGTRLAIWIGNKAVVAGGLTLYSAALLWISTLTKATPYPLIAVMSALLGTGVGLILAPATEAIMDAVPAERAGVGSAVNDATRLFGGTLGVAVIGSVGASLYASRLTPTLPLGLPQPAITAAKGSVAGATAVAQKATQAGQAVIADRLSDAAIPAFLHSFTGGCLVAAGVAAAGALTAVFLLPARPAAPKREALAFPAAQKWPGAQQWPAAQKWPGAQQWPAAQKWPGTGQWPPQQWPGTGQWPAGAPPSPAAVGRQVTIIASTAR